MYIQQNLCYLIYVYDLTITDFIYYTTERHAEQVWNENGSSEYSEWILQTDWKSQETWTSESKVNDFQMLFFKHFIKCIKHYNISLSFTQKG